MPDALEENGGKVSKLSGKIVTNLGLPLTMAIAREEQKLEALGPVVQGIVSLTSSLTWLRGQLVKCFTT